jgi:DNA invertase Pin-like site-specific DNA recombinase
VRGREGSSQHLVCFLEELDGIRSPVKAGLGRARSHGTKSGKPIGQQPLARHKVEQIRAELQKGTGIIKTARLCGTGVSAVQRIKREMAA